MTTRNSEGTGPSSCVGEGSDNPALWDPVQCRNPSIDFSRKSKKSVFTKCDSMDNQTLKYS